MVVVKIRIKIFLRYPRPVVHNLSEAKSTVKGMEYPGKKAKQVQVTKVANVLKKKFEV